MCEQHRKLEGAPTRVGPAGQPRQLSDRQRAREVLHGLYAVQESVAALTGPQGLGEWRIKVLADVCTILGVQPPTLEALEARLGALEFPEGDRAYLTKPLRS